MLEHGPGFAKARLQISPNHLNSVDTVHGGVLFALADAAFSVASNSHGAVSVSIQASIANFQAVREGALSASAREVARNPKLATYSVEVRDDSGSLVALFQGTVYRKSMTLEQMLG